MAIRKKNKGRAMKRSTPSTFDDGRDVPDLRGAKRRRRSEKKGRRNTGSQDIGDTGVERDGVRWWEERRNDSQIRISYR